MKLQHTQHPKEIKKSPLEIQSSCCQKISVLRATELNSIQCLALCFGLFIPIAVSHVTVSGMRDHSRRPDRSTRGRSETLAHEPTLRRIKKRWTRSKRRCAASSRVYLVDRKRKRCLYIGLDAVGGGGITSSLNSRLSRVVTYLPLDSLMR